MPYKSYYSYLSYKKRCLMNDNQQSKPQVPPLGEVRRGLQSQSPSLGRAGEGLLTLHDAQRLVDEWIKQYGVRYFSELTNMACLTEEVGELARIMARRYGDQSFKEGEPTDPADEMADVLWVLLALATRRAWT